MVIFQRNHPSSKDGNSTLIPKKIILLNISPGYIVHIQKNYSIHFVQNITACTDKIQCLPVVFVQSFQGVLVRLDAICRYIRWFSFEQFFTRRDALCTFVHLVFFPKFLVIFIRKLFLGLELFFFLLSNSFFSGLHFSSPFLRRNFFLKLVFLHSFYI